MGSAPVVIDISSDDDDDVLTNWIDELLDGKEEDLNGIVLLDQFLSSVEIPEVKSKSVDDSDDDCLILDGDPDKLAEVKDGNGGGGGDGSDDLLIVGEKGQIACRDYPHSRHLCASFPFSTTPHEKHCSLCHCYVCDSPAPCVHWGNGDSLAHHCHATDKAETWKLQRKFFKRGGETAASPKEKPPILTPRVILPPVRNPAPVPAPVSASRLTRPSISNPPRPYFAHRGLKLCQHRSPPPVPGTRCMQKERNGAGALARSIIQSHSKFKRPGAPGSGLTGSSTPTTQRPQYPWRPPQQAIAARIAPYNVSSVSQLRPVMQQQIQPMSQYPRAVDLSWLQSQRAPTPVMQLEDTRKSWQDLLTGVASELCVSIGESTPTIQPYAASSQCPSLGNPIPYRIGPEDLDCDWLDGAAGGLGLPVEPRPAGNSSKGTELF